MYFETVNVWCAQVQYCEVKFVNASDVSSYSLCCAASYSHYRSSTIR